MTGARALPLALLMLAAPAAAMASDASLERGWTRFLESPNRLSALGGLDEGVSTSSRAQPLRPFRRALRSNARLIARTRSDRRGDSPSSDTGAKARRAALDSLRESRFVVRRYQRAVPLIGRILELPEESARVQRLEKRITRLLKPLGWALLRAGRFEARASRRFARAA